jgi:hypothetical protein
MASGGKSGDSVFAAQPPSRTAIASSPKVKSFIAGDGFHAYSFLYEAAERLAS